MLALGIETSSIQGSLILWDLKTHQVLKKKIWIREQSHSEFVTHYLDQLMSDAKVDWKKVELVAVGVGPGSFTGLRVGINVARTLAYSLNAPLFAVSSLRLLAESFLTSSDTVFASVPALKNMIYAAVYQRSNSMNQTFMEPQAIAGEALHSMVKPHYLCVGAGNALLVEHLGCGKDHINVFPSAESFPSIYQSNQKREFIAWQDLRPLYIRASEAEEKLSSGLLKPSESF
jgi:tRNA threonylcarbamoyladenosine biosynthesis protein TsaB